MFLQLRQVDVNGAGLQEHSLARSRLSQTAEQEEEDAGG